MENRKIELGTHGEEYGNWMSNPVFYMLGGRILLSALLTILAFTVLHLPVLGIVFAVILAAITLVTCWFAWIRKQYSFGGGGMIGITAKNSARRMPDPKGLATVAVFRGVMQINWIFRMKPLTL